MRSSRIYACVLVYTRINRGCFSWTNEKLNDPIPTLCVFLVFVRKPSSHQRFWPLGSNGANGRLNRTCQCSNVKKELGVLRRPFEFQLHITLREPTFVARDLDFHLFADHQLYLSNEEFLVSAGKHASLYSKTARDLNDHSCLYFFLIKNPWY